MTDITLVAIIFMTTLLLGSALSLFWTYRSSKRQQREKEIRSTTRKRLNQIIQQQ